MVRSGGGKIDGLKPRDSGVQMVLVSYEQESQSFSAMLCSALVPGGHADKVRHTQTHYIYIYIYIYI